MLTKRNVQILAVIACGICAVKVIKAFSPQDFGAVEAEEAGLLGFVPLNQYMILNATNLGLPVPPPNPNCTVQLSVGDGQGHTIKRGPVVPLAPGHSTSLEVMAADLTSASGVTNLAPASRVELLPLTDIGGACRLATSVEVVMLSTGQTSVYASHGALTLNHSETMVRDTEQE